jgi:iron(III) transport system ATP-binding protein
LESADEGQIRLAERTVFDSVTHVDVPPNKRDIGMVFQSYALWPHMTVRKNIGYPLRARRVRRSLANRWIEQTAELVYCQDLLERYPAELSGGQQQRVALARGIVARPGLILFDEPLSNLDARLRDQVRTEIHELHAHLQFTAVYVTHDQDEAIALGDRLAVMRSGRIEQLGAPERIFKEPATEYVAEFMGMNNRILLERREGTWWHGREPITGDLNSVDHSLDKIIVRARPEDLRLIPPDTTGPPGTLTFKVSIVDVEFGGRYLNFTVTADDARLHSLMPGDERNVWLQRLETGQQATGVLLLSELNFYRNDGVRTHISVDQRGQAAIGQTLR